MRKEDFVRKRDEVFGLKKPRGLVFVFKKVERGCVKETEATIVSFSVFVWLLAWEKGTPGFFWLSALQQDFS